MLEDYTASILAETCPLPCTLNITYTKRTATTNLLKGIHTIFINIYHYKEEIRGVVLGIAPRVGKNSELIKRFSVEKLLLGTTVNV